MVCSTNWTTIGDARTGISPDPTNSAVSSDVTSNCDESVAALSGGSGSEDVTLARLRDVTPARAIPATA